MRTLTLVGLLSTTLMASGCTYFAQLTARELVKARLAETVHEARVTVSKRSEFVACFEQRGGACPAAPQVRANAATLQTEGLHADVTQARSSAAAHALTAVNRVVDHPMHQHIVDLFNRLRSSESTQDLTIDLKELGDFADAIEEATNSGAWEALEQHKTEQMSRRGPAPSGAPAGANEQLARQARTAAFLRAYMDAYFRNGKFLTVNVGSGAALDELKAELRKQLPGITDDAIDKMIADLKSKYGEKVFGAISTEGFVTRDGSTFQFPAITAQLTLALRPTEKTTRIDASAVGADLVRVYFEAIFDAHDGLPAVSNATGAATRLAEFALPSQSSVSGGLTDEEFGLVKERADKAEATTSAAFGRLIRGTTWLSLNNEALAKLLETVVGVTVKKVTEKAVWCWYSCKHASPDAAAWDVRLAPDAVEHVVRIRVQ